MLSFPRAYLFRTGGRRLGVACRLWWESSAGACSGQSLCPFKGVSHLPQCCSSEGVSQSRSAPQGYRRSVPSTFKIAGGIGKADPRRCSVGEGLVPSRWWLGGFPGPATAIAVHDGLSSPPTGEPIRPSLSPGWRRGKAEEHRGSVSSRRGRARYSAEKMMAES